MTEEVKPEPPLSQEQDFSLMLEHAVHIASHILDSVGDSEEALKSSSVTLSCDFVMDLTDYVVQMACRYEDFSESMDRAIVMYQEQSKRQVKFGSRTVH